MNRESAGWIGGAIVLLGLAAVSVIFGLEQMTSSADMKAKLGTMAPSIVAWGMIWVTVLISIALAGYLVVIGLGKSGHSQ